MLRFPNPGSDVSGYIRIFQALFDELQASQPFSLDDMTRVMVGRNLATSSGYMGQEALERSTRKNRSLDPFYNQSKAYSELYRILGWQHPQPDNKLLFSCTRARLSQARVKPRWAIKASYSSKRALYSKNGRGSALRPKRPVGAGPSVSGMKYQLFLTPAILDQSSFNLLTP